MSVQDYSRVEMDPECPVITYTTRAQAIVHISIYDALVGVTREAPTYYDYGSLPTFTSWSMPAAAYGAIGEAATQTLLSLYRKSKSRIYVARARYELSFGTSSAGRTFGGLVARTVLGDRDNDGSDALPPFIDAEVTAETTLPYEHAPDPTVTPKQMVHAPHWGDVRPFGLGDITTIPAAPDPLSLAYVASYQEVVKYGGTTSAARTDHETFVGIWWAYDGAYKIGTPHRVYTQCMDAIIARAGGAASTDTGAGLAAAYAVLNIVMADAAISAWREKYRWNFWRPVVGVRRGDDDDYDETVGIPGWTPLGSPATNTLKAPMTPSFPAYPSGHATVGTAMFAAIEELLGVSADFSFSVVGSEYDGNAKDEAGKVRPRVDHRMTIAGAIAENEKSRVYLGVHWAIDCEEGKAIGHSIASAIVSSFPERA